MTIKGALKIILGISGSILVFLLLAVYSYFNGIPFLEGVQVINSGESHGLKIGMTKDECLVVIKNKYKKKGNTLRSFWKREADEKQDLLEYQNTSTKNDRHREYSGHEIQILNIEELTPPLSKGDKWRIDLGRTTTLFLDFNEDILARLLYPDLFLSEFKLYVWNRFYLAVQV